VTLCHAAMGAEAIKQLLDRVDVDTECEQLKEDLKSATGQKRTRAIRRLDILDAFRSYGSIGRRPFRNK